MEEKLEDYRDILIDIFGTVDIENGVGKLKLISNFIDYDCKFKELEIVYNDKSCWEFRKRIIECHLYVLKIYQSIIYNIIYEFAHTKFGYSLDYVLLNFFQEEITLKLKDFLNKKGYPKEFNEIVYSEITEAAKRLNKRFSFDEMALINLIEASCGNNIYTETGYSSSTKGGNNKYVVKTENGYKYARTSDTAIAKSGNEIYVKDRRTIDDSKIISPLSPERQEESKIIFESFPLGNTLPKTTDGIMQKLISNLFENLNLCIETYNSIYCKGDNVVDNTATLADGSKFDFQFIINEINIPHLLGIPNPHNNVLNIKSIQILKKLDPSFSEKSSALDLLKLLLKHQNEIIALGGLYEEHGKKYEILNWEKIVLKTASFMRGDFFKTCFCLVELSKGKKINGASRLSISSTEYQNGISSTVTARSVLNDLLSEVRNKKDYIFRGFLYDEKKNRNIVNTIMTGKAETIEVGKKKEIVKTLQKYRNLLKGESGISGRTYVSSEGFEMAFDENQRDEDELIGSIVEEVVNEKYIKTFTPEEQAALGINISRDLSLIPTVSREAVDVLQDVHSFSDAVTSEEIDKFSNAIGQGHKK